MHASIGTFLIDARFIYAIMNIEGLVICVYFYYSINGVSQ